MRVLIAGLIGGVIFYFIPGLRSGPASIIAAALCAILLLTLGPRSILEKIGVMMLVGVVAWVAGPRAAHNESLLWYLTGWFAAGTALAFYLHPQSE